MRAIHVLVSVVAFVVITAAAVPRASGPASAFAPAAATLRQLRGVDELKSWFNAYKGQPRLIFLVSPT